MSPHEREVLATIEKKLHDEDAEPAAVLGRPPSPSFSTSEFPLSIRHVLLLLAALIGLIAVYTMLPERFDAAGLAALTAVAVVPWLVATVRSAERRPSAAGASDGPPTPRDGNEPGRSGGTGPLRAKRRILLAAVPLLVIVALAFPDWQPGIALVLILLAANFLPWLVVGVVERFERPSRSPRPRNARTTDSRDGSPTTKTLSSAASPSACSRSRRARSSSFPPAGRNVSRDAPAQLGASQLVPQPAVRLGQARCGP